MPEEIPAVRMAPLLLRERLEVSGGADWVEVPSLHFSEGSETLHGRSYTQWTYRWRLDLAPDGTVGSSPWQGIRITLNTAGDPVIWEVLRDSSRASLVFVARSLEAAAFREFGSVLPGRRFAIERGLTDARDVVVARVIEDGPVPMGPILHLRAATGDISTLICRCMPPQVKELAGQGEYELLPASSDGLDGEESFVPARVGSGLRLPSAF